MLMILRGQAFWPKVFEGSLTGDDTKYQVDICHLDDDTVKKLEDSGLTVRIHDPKKEHYKGTFISAKGNRPPKVFDAAKRPWNPKILIGNGSNVKISAMPYDWTYEGKAGRSLGLNQLMVVEHVEYVVDELEAEEEVPFDDEDDVEL